MKVHSLSQEQTIPISIKEAWSFFSSPKNLEAMTPPDMGFKIVSLPSETLYEGEIIQYSVKALPGIWIPWISEIKSLHEGESFVDDQISGPFKFWHHRHSFEEIDGGTIVKDLIHYTVGFGVFGEIARALVVKKQLAKMFEHRRVVLEEKFGKTIPSLQ
ncbi:MAG: SRPBCC family protein [Akkermansiaceae bacterium]|jgi:ligand-binding SRPBCC domain-containing protein